MIARQRGIDLAHTMWRDALPRSPVSTLCEAMNAMSDDTSGRTPIDDFSQCHAGILGRLGTLAELPALLEPAARARRLAADTIDFFRNAVMAHHADEEKRLFPAVLAAAEPGAEHDRAKSLVDALTAEHRKVEAAWARLEPGLKAVAKGRDAELVPADIAALLDTYQAHAHFEEDTFLPLAQTILARKSGDMAALGFAMHASHALPDLMRRLGRAL